jgi:hypothetical protein
MKELAGSIADDANSFTADTPSSSKLSISLGVGSGACVIASFGGPCSGKSWSSAVFSVIDISGVGPVIVCMRAGPARKLNNRTPVIPPVILAIRSGRKLTSIGPFSVRNKYLASEASHVLSAVEKRIVGASCAKEGGKKSCKISLNFSCIETIIVYSVTPLSR